MDSQVTRSAWVGAGLAFLLSLLVVIVAGGRPSKESASIPAPAHSQAPTPTLDPVK
jgi:hypothetical protein